MNIIAFVVAIPSTAAPRCSMFTVGGFAICAPSVGVGGMVQEAPYGR